MLYNIQIECVCIRKMVVLMIVCAIQSQVQVTLSTIRLSLPLISRRPPSSLCHHRLLVLCQHFLLSLVEQFDLRKQNVLYKLNL